jgi:acyl-CoA synthetase (NDP forming)
MVAIVSQSGNVGSVIMKLLARANVGVSRFMATGNECDIDIADGIAWLAEDAATKVILCCMETCRDAKRLTTALDIAHAAGKPVVIFKIGGSEAGQAAAKSHTGALAGGDKVFDSVFARHRAVRVDGIERLVELGGALVALGDRSIGADPSVALVAASGGFGIAMADAASKVGLKMLPVSNKAADRIHAVLPLAATGNPVDATAQMSANPEVLEELLSALLEDETNDVTCIMIALGFEVPRLRDVYLDAFRLVAARYPQRVLVACVFGVTEAIGELTRAGVVCFPTIDATFEGLAALARMSAARTRPPAPVIADKPRDIAPLNPATFRNEAEAKRALAAAGIPVLDERVAVTEEQAALFAVEIGQPLVMKILSQDIQHKSDIGGVELNIEGADAARSAFKRLLQAAKTNAPKACVDGVLLAPLVSGGTELILGTKLDPIFGPVVMVGLGGVFAEIFGDTALRAAPVSPEEAEEMLRGLKAFPLLDGARGRPRADIKATAAVISTLSYFALAHANEVAEIDINPLLVKTAGQGVIILDALLIPTQASPMEPNA